MENFNDGEKNQSSHLKVKESLSRSKFERAWASQYKARLPQVPGSPGEQGVDSIKTEQVVWGGVREEKTHQPKPMMICLLEVLFV